MTRISPPASSVRLSRIGAAALTAALMWSVVAAAQDSPVLVDPNAIVATVNGETITEGDLAFVREDVAAQLQSVPPEQVRAILLAQMISLKLMAKAGTEAKLGESELFKRRISYLTSRAMSRAYVQENVGVKITDEAIKAEYDRIVGSAPNEELHVQHILVSTEDDAKAIKASLDAGGDFAAIAGDKSIDPSAKQNGGDLGFVPYWEVVKPFADAAWALKDGETSGPVQSDYGWHIIRVIERRPATKPPLEQLSGQIAQRLYSDLYQGVFESLKNAATIEVPDAALKAQVDAQLAH
ncbi:MAG: peptidylprolyl isomerase [Devosia sp.]